LSPFPADTARQVVKNKKAILVVESSMGQFSRMVKSNLFGADNLKVVEMTKPALGIDAEEIIRQVEKILKESKNE
jgi:pyruvate/2-oxoacid:ferredoxin oxidoreductase alpha subunit